MVGTEMPVATMLNRVGAVMVIVLLAGCVGEAADQVSRAIPTQLVEDYEIYSDSAEDLAQRADVVFLGEIVRVEEDALVLSPDSEDPDDALTVFRGVVFEPIEVLKGVFSGEIVIAMPIELRNPSGAARARLETLPDGVIAPGISDVATGGASRRYLVFASPIAGGSGLYAFYSSGGVVEVLPNDRLAPGAAPPFVERPDRDVASMRTWAEVREAIISALEGT